MKPKVRGNKFEFRLNLVSSHATVRAPTDHTRSRSPRYCLSHTQLLSLFNTTSPLVEDLGDLPWVIAIYLQIGMHLETLGCPRSSLLTKTSLEEVGNRHR